MIGMPTRQTAGSVRREFAVTYDYRCPFARNAHEAVVAALRAGEGWRVRFLAFSLDQVHVPEGEPPAWERPPGDRGKGVLALEWGLAVRDAFPERFFEVHLGIFAARFDEGRRLDEEAVLRDVVERAGLDPGAVAGEVATGRPLKTLAAEHAEAVGRWAVFGVPTFIQDDETAFVRLMERGRIDDVERALDMLTWTRLNEFKRTRIPR